MRAKASITLTLDLEVEGDSVPDIRELVHIARTGLVGGELESLPDLHVMIVGTSEPLHVLTVVES